MKTEFYRVYGNCKGIGSLRKNLFVGNKNEVKKFISNLNREFGYTYFLEELVINFDEKMEIISVYFGNIETI